jgi:hypothetical protein
MLCGQIQNNQLTEDPEGGNENNAISITNE